MQEKSRQTLLPEPKLAYDQPPEIFRRLLIFNMYQNTSSTTLDGGVSTISGCWQM